MAITYETHSITEDNERGIATGHLPGRLSARGREVAAELGARYRAEPPDAVYTSDLRRAVETARIAFGDTGIPVLQDPRLRECDYGDLNGRPVAELAKVRSAHIDRPFPGGGQSYREVIEATREFLRDLVAERDGQRVVIIAHSANRWALHVLLGGEAIERLVNAPFNWQPGWHYTVTAGSIEEPVTGPGTADSAH
ncbi:histidine phosphatase family protein [Glycomyces luteolus]|uniref:Histidine phosphatase family protein n=1 Tax=Glycomyces luteolus TaxID=2670330 RepID=A0A9X3P8S5_9ACTN|nr:histidine phosphatase family protein [Glycomyces luteolus]MDA1359701.1 histidine phosphatase family protein [Glycomyces luteolus]